MNKVLVTVGIFAITVGIILTALPLVNVPNIITQAYLIPIRSEEIIGAWHPIGPVDPATSCAKGVSLSAGDWLNIQVNATPGKNINLYIKSGATTADYLYAGTTQTFFRNVTYLNENWTVPVSSQYAFVFNSSTPFSYRDVNVLVMKQTGQTAYRDIISNVPLVPFEVLYCGVAVVLSGLAITVVAVMKSNPKN
jgi:hypothetical protein